MQTNFTERGWGMFSRKLQIRNFKCFQNETIENLAVPNGNKGSGLNILIGENGNGKTTFLEAVIYLTLNSYSVKNKLSINDFNDYIKFYFSSFISL